MRSGFDFEPARRPRRLSLTPMIDVVVLLLIFFMLSARFGSEASLALAPVGGGTAPWSGPPRLVTLAPAGPSLNGVPTALADLSAAVAPLMPAPDAPVVIKTGPDADVQALAAVVAALSAAGISNLIVLE